MGFFTVPANTTCLVRQVVFLDMRIPDAPPSSLQVELVFQTKGKGKRKYSKEEILGNPQRLYVGNHEND